ncbi:MAG TPA: sigma factor-like helix-turn-helix DNA-binding protein [Tepidisphaeraceae bacterium]|jgi:DNA-directed RNA polymerase specialized sigma24 family protein|nr:sigma factor-like helix-turn-helix DNA-binding protein [Tepidisphaeraceae bacterium]
MTTGDPIAHNPALHIDEELFHRAKKLERPAVEALVESVYPAICRIAYGLCGRQDVGHGIVRFVANHALHQLKHWRDAASAQRWFYHFTVLVSRRGRKHEPSAQQDTLIEHSGEVSAAYVAFVRGFRALPFQQREAYLLTFGEQLLYRDVATAMDCSIAAVEVHLQGAQQILRSFAGDSYEKMKERLTRAYSNLSPREEAIHPSVRNLINRLMWPRRLKFIFKIILTLALLLALAFLAWHFRHLYLKH